jgi:hypothetical protein
MCFCRVGAAITLLVVVDVRTFSFHRPTTPQELGTPLHYALRIKTPVGYDIVKALIEAGADMDAANKVG